MPRRRFRWQSLRRHRRTGAPQPRRQPRGACRPRRIAARQARCAWWRRGSSRCPSRISKAVQDVAIQLVRNCGRARHRGRRDRAASSARTRRASCAWQFRRHGTTFELQFQDDGAGIVADRVRETAVRRGLSATSRRESLDVRQETLGLIFKAGFSTHDGADRDAGRGVGLDVVRRTVRTSAARSRSRRRPASSRGSASCCRPAARQDAVA